jgi:hypothetical protein
MIIMHIRKALLASAAAPVAALAIFGATASASAGTSTTTAFTTTTISAEHADTTGVTCSACLQGPGGPIWADDHLKETVNVTSAGAPGHYNVNIRFGGSTFSGFADPRANGEAGSDGSTTGGPMFSQGKITGSISYNDIASSNAPKALPASLPVGSGLSVTLSDLFNGGNGPAATTHYSVNYTPSLNSVDPTGTSTGNVWTAGTVYNQTG